MMKKENKKTESNLKWILLAILSLIWGSSFILIKKSLEYFDSYQVGSLRIIITGLFLLPIAIMNIKKFPKKRLKWLLVVALLGSFFPVYLFPMAQKEVSSSIAGIINSTVPIFVIIVGALFWKIKATKREMLGVLIAFIGVCVLLIGGGSIGELKLFPMFLLLLASSFYAISGTTIKANLQDLPSQVLSSFIFSYVLMIPGLIALSLTGFFQEFSFTSENLRGLGYISILSIVGTGLALMLYFKMINMSSPLFASTVTLIMPIIAVIWGIIDGESLTVLQSIGTIIILGGLIFLRQKKNV